MPSHTATHPSKPSLSKLPLWQQKLSTLDFPINSLVAKEMRDEINNPESTAQSLATLALQDPPLCLRLYQYAQEQLKARDGEAQSLVHIISLLGFDALSELIKTAPRETSLPDGYYDIIAASLFAAQLAKILLPPKHGTLGERFFLPGLFFNSVLWGMWQLAPKMMAQAQHLAGPGQQSLDLLGQQKLGFPLTALYQQAGTLFHLPRATQKALSIAPEKHLHLWAKAHRFSPKRLEQWLQTHSDDKQLFCAAETGIYLINHYCLAIYFDWQGKHRRRLSLLLAKHLTLSVEELDNCAYQSADTMELPKWLQGLHAPQSRLKGLHKEAIPIRTATAAPQKPAAQIHNQFQQRQQANTPNNAVKDMPWLKQCIDQLNAKESPFANLQAILQTTLQALQNGIGIGHCMIIKPNTDHTQLRHYLNLGLESSPLSTLRQPIDHAGELLAALLKQAASLNITPASLAKRYQQLPDEFSDIQQPGALSSIFHQQQPVAIIYASDALWSKHHYHYFKLVGQGTTHAIATYTHQQSTH